MKHIGTVVLETKRCILRPFVLSDARAMFEHWAGDTEVTRYLTWPAHKNVQETEQVISAWISHYKEADFISGVLWTGKRSRLLAPLLR